MSEAMKVLRDDMDEPPASENRSKSDIPGYNIFFAKIAISVDKKDFEDYQLDSERRWQLER